MKPPWITTVSDVLTIKVLLISKIEMCITNTKGCTKNTKVLCTEMYIEKCSHHALIMFNSVLNLLWNELKALLLITKL